MSNPTPKNTTPGGGKFWIGAVVITGVAIAAGTLLRERAAGEEAAELTGSVMTQRVGFGAGFTGDESEEEIVGMNDAGALLSTEALSCVCDFIDADDIAIKSGFVTNSAAVLPAMEEYYAKYEMRDYEEDDFAALSLPVAMVRDELAAFALIPRSGNRDAYSFNYPCDVEALLLCVRDPATSKFRLDWETYIQTKHKRMPKYYERPRENTEVLRMFLTLASKPDANAPGRGQYEFEAGSPGTVNFETMLYIPDSSPQVTAIVAGLDGGARSRYATVEASWALDNNGVMRPSIARLLSWGSEGTGWTDEGAPAPQAAPVAKVAAR